MATSSTSILPAAASLTPNVLIDDPAPVRHASPVVAFIIGLAIVLLASILNAAGLNLTKLDHVRSSAIPKASRRQDWLRPLWILGMTLYILSQLIGSTLALEYMRAEYVAPLGSSSLVFNFLFARFLVGTPVTSTDIYGTIVVVIGVIGIVAFGSINSGLASETHVEHLTYLWRRGGWLSYFFFMSFALILLLMFTSSLDAVLSARSDLGSEPFSGISARRGASPVLNVGVWGRLKTSWKNTMLWIRDKLEIWTAAKDDKQLAWTLGIGWACCGGGLAGGCLVFAKATVKLVSGSLSHENTGNQLGHAAPVFTIILMAITAVLQIICLNRGLKVYDSTLVVPVFYGVYTATGWLDSLIFNDEVDSYKSWTLFLIFVSILILISGVVLLTHKKPERVPPKGPAVLGSAASRKKGKGSDISGNQVQEEEGEDRALRRSEEGDRGTLWQVGDMSDDEDDVHSGVQRPDQAAVKSRHEEGVGLIETDHEEADEDPRLSSSERNSAHPKDPFRDDPDDFGDWEGGSGSLRMN